MKSSNLLFIQKCLTESSCCYHDSLPYLTVTSAMMLLFDNSIPIGDTFYCFTSDTKGLLTSIDVADIKRVSNAIYSFALDGDYQSAHLLNPYNNVPLDYAILSQNLNNYDTVIDVLEHARSIAPSLLENKLLTNDINIVKLIYSIGKLVFIEDFFVHLSDSLNVIKNELLHNLDRIVLKGLLEHPVFACHLEDGTYEIYICTHSIPKGMSSDHFELIGFDNNAHFDNIKDGGNRATTRYVSKFRYSIPDYYIKEIDESFVAGGNLPSFKSKLIEHHLIEKDKGVISPRLLYLNNTGNTKQDNLFLELTYDPLSKDVVSMYKDIYKSIGIEPNKVWFNNTNYIHGYKQNWLIK